MRNTKPRWRPIRWLMAATMAAAGAIAPVQAAEVQFPTGSRIGLVPPPGLTVSVTPPGFHDPENKVAVLMVELPPAAYAQLESMMTTEAAEKQGIIVDRRETLFTDAGAALLSSGEDTRANVHKWMLLALLPGFTALVSVQVPPFARERYPDAPASGADVDDHRMGFLSRQRYCFLNDELGLLPWYQYVRSDFERQTPELAHAEDVRHRFPALASGDQRLVLQQEDARRFFGAIGQKTGAIPADRKRRSGRRSRRPHGRGRGPCSSPARTRGSSPNQSVRASAPG